RPCRCWSSGSAFEAIRVLKTTTARHRLPRAPHRRASSHRPVNLAEKLRTLPQDSLGGDPSYHLAEVAHAVAAGAVARRERPVADPPALPALLEGVGDLLDRADQEMRRLENVLDAESKRPTGGCGSARRVPRDDHPVHDGVQLELREALSGGRADPVKSLLDPRRTAVEAGGCPAPRARWPTLHIPRDADGVCHRGRELEDAL